MNIRGMISAIGILLTSSAVYSQTTIDTTKTKQLEEVIVTANKREESIIKVNTSITSLSSKKLEDTRTWGLSGLTALVPNYNYQELGVSFQQIQSIRGIQVFSENPAVSTYIDDVNNIDILANGFAFTDIERIEILRGPQGTLYGRNAMGGVVNIITKKPTNQTNSFAETSFGNLGLQRYSTGIKTPIIKDKLYFGLNGLYQTQDGFLKNNISGTSATDTNLNGKSVGGEKNLYGNMFLKWLVNNRFHLTLNLKGQQDKSNNSGFMVSQFSDTYAFANPDVINLSRIQSHERNILNTSLVAKYNADKFTITSISALQTISFGFKDLDFPGIYHSYYDGKIGELLPPQKVWSQELRINSHSDSKFQYTAGVYAFTQKGYEPTTNTAYELSDAEAAAFSLPSGTYLINRNRSNNSGLAGFGEMSYQLTNKLKATVGLRYDYEKREATFNGFGDAMLFNGVVTDINPNITADGNYSAISPKFSVNYSVNELSNIYATYTRGFRAGGINASSLPAGVRQTFDPEYSNNYEIGYKSFLLDKKLSIGASAFLIQWKDLQFYNLVAPFTYARENVGDAQSMGIELEVSALPAKGLQLDGSFGFNPTEYKGFDLKRVNFGTGVESTTAIGGNKLSNAPTHTLFLGAQYEYSINQKLKAIVRGEIRNLGKQYTDIQNQIEQPSYTLLNSRIGLTYGKYSLFIWGQNLTNERYLAYGNPDSSFGRQSRMAQPRTFGLTLSAKF
ncbi:TonB-dependent receptor [Flavobacterium sp.]|jgi:iron complex outermembrane receptor protein|uniref:TonB-dependent receptor n=1 Tax=Flavobacterium sp. TaxID=239 RepID=UPI0037C1A07D